MSIAISTEVQKAYEDIKGDQLKWAVFAYEGQQELKVQATGEDDYDEFPDEFNDGRLQYAFLRVQDPNSKLPKFVLIGWCGDGAPRKGVFQQHFASVASKLAGYHVQITARSSEDVEMQEIEKKVADASGANYSVSQTATTSSVFGSTVPKKTNSLVNQLKQQNSGAPLVSARKPLAPTAPRLPNTTPVAAAKPIAARTVSTRKTDDWDTQETAKAEPVKLPGLNNKQEDTREAPVKSSYQPIGRPDIAALRAQAAGDEKPSRGSTGTAYTPAEVPKTGALADRMSAFTNNTSSSSETTSTRPRNVSNPLASRFGKPAFGTKPALPGTQQSGSKALGGLSKNFGADNGKTPAQLWQERKARERGETVPEDAPREAPVKATQYGQDDEDVRDKMASLQMKEETPAPAPVARAHAQVPVRPRTPTPEPEPEQEEEQEPEVEEAAAPPPPPMNTRPAAARAPSPEPEPEPEPEPQPEPEQEQEQEEETAPPAQISFKDQLAAKIGGGPTAAPSATNTPAAPASNGKLQARVLYDYDAAEEGEVSLVEGALVTQIDQIDEGWWSGTNDAGETGLFPANYVELVEASGQIGAGSGAGTGAAASSGPSKGLCAIAEYSYEVGEEGEIGFEEGEEITHIDQVDEGWWQGRNAAGQEGLFPSSYVQLKK